MEPEKKKDWRDFLRLPEDRQERLQILKLIPLYIAAAGIVGILFVMLVRSDSSAPEPVAKSTGPNYNTSRLCNVEGGDDIDHGKLDDWKFSVQLREGCWSGWVTIPHWWQEWHVQLNDSRDWIAQWFQGTSPAKGRWRAHPPGGISTMNDNLEFVRNSMYGALDTFRVQGSGTAVFYTNVHKATPPREDARRAAAPSEPAPLSVEPIKPAAPAHESKSPSGTAKEADRFVFKLDACKLDVDNVICDFAVTNRAEDRTLRFNGQATRIYDSAGTDHAPSRITLGSKECEGRRKLRGKSQSAEAAMMNPAIGCNVDAMLPADVPMALTIRFERIPTDSTEIRRMDISFERSVLAYYGIPLQK